MLYLLFNIFEKYNPNYKLSPSKKNTYIFVIENKSYRLIFEIIRNICYNIYSYSYGFSLNLKKIFLKSLLYFFFVNKIHYLL